MKYKKILFSVLEDVEKKKIEQQKMYLKELYIQQKKHIKQLKLLINFRNEYIKKLHVNLKLGISIHAWKIYNNFICMLYIAVEENNNVIKKYKITIKNTIDQWLRNHIKLKTWNYLNQKNKRAFKKRRILEENIISDEFSQFKLLKKGSY